MYPYYDNGDSNHPGISPDTKRMEDKMSEKIIMFEELLGPDFPKDTIQKLADMVPDNIPPAGVVPMIAGAVKRLPAGLSGDEIVKMVSEQMSSKAKESKKQAASQPGSTRTITRNYYDSLLIEMRLMGAVEPSTEITLFGERFASPVMTGAMSHMSRYVKGEDGPMEHLARGAKEAGCLHWVGMVENEPFEQIMATGAKVVRVVKPYADEAKIFDHIKKAEELGCVAIAMDIDHAITATGENDIAMGTDISQKTLAQMRSYVEATHLPFIIKGVLSVHDALAAKEIGAAGVLVSHHGGRLTYLVPPAKVLPDIRKAVGPDMLVFADCSVQSGMDVYKAMALGANAVGVGSHLAGIARSQGAEGVAERMKEMTAELKGAMYFTGVADCQSFDPTVIHHKDF